jgi:hypothetical protein
MIFEPDETDRRRRKETEQIRTGLAPRIAAFVGDAEERTTSLPNLSFALVRKPTSPASYLYDPCISMIIQGKKRVQLGGTTYVYDESRFLLTAVNLPTTTEVLEASPKVPYLSLLLRLDLQAARQMIAGVDMHESSRSVGGPAMATGPATIELFDAIKRVVDLLDNPKDLLHLGTLIQREIIYRILTSSAGAHFRETVLLGTQSQRTAKAITWLRENFAQPLRIEDLADMADMGVSTLHHHLFAHKSQAGNASDEELVERWSENVVWQYFSGLAYYTPKRSCDATQIGRFRTAIGDRGSRNCSRRASMRQWK